PARVSVCDPRLTVPLAIFMTSETLVASCSVHPPPEPLNIRSKNGEPPVVIVFPEAVLFKVTVPESLPKVPAFEKLPPMVMPRGAVKVPAEIVRLLLMVSPLPDNSALLPPDKVEISAEDK